MRLGFLGALGLLVPAGNTVGPLPAPDRAVPVVAAPARTGVVEGVVRLDLSEASAPARLSPYARRRYRPPAPSTQNAVSAADVVVYVLVSGPHAAPRQGGARIVQKDLTIVPHVTAVQTGTRVDFPNEDDVFHNLFSLSAARPFNLGRYPRGQSRSEIFGKPGVVRMFCDIHSEMSAVVLVLDTPHFSRPDSRGRYRIAGVPEGRHRLVAWHESAGADTTEIVVSASGSETADFALPRSAR